MATADSLNSMFNDDSNNTEPVQSTFFLIRYKTLISQRFQKFLDDSNYYVKTRWAFFIGLSCLYILRVWLLSGWHIISYALAIYLLNLLISFLTPQVDPNSDPLLPTRVDDEFRPFIRRLPEFKFWYAAMRAVIIAICCTFVNALNIPVFWPILVLYFIILFTVSMKRQILHMWQHKYIPFTFGKPSFKRGKERQQAK